MRSPHAVCGTTILDGESPERSTPCRGVQLSCIPLAPRLCSTHICGDRRHRAASDRVAGSAFPGGAGGQRRFALISFNTVLPVPVVVPVDAVTSANTRSESGTRSE